MNNKDLATHLLLDRLTLADEERRAQAIEHRDLVLREIERIENNVAQLASIAKRNSAEIQKAKNIGYGAILAAITLGGLARIVNWKDIVTVFLKQL